MRHRPSAEDRRFQDDFESGAFTSALGHREHLRLAYVHLADHSTSEAIKRIRRSIQSFLRRRAIDPGKYHETVTQSWMMAVRHFMEKSPPTHSFDAFVELNPRLIDSRLMLTHYSCGLLNSDQARANFVEPDLDAIPRYDD